MTHEVFIVSTDDAGQRLDRWVRKMRPDLSYGVVQKMMRTGQVRVNGKRAKADARLDSGAEVRVMGVGVSEDDAPPKGAWSADKCRAYVEALVIFEDDDILVINKPSGLAVQGGSGLDFHLEMMLKHYKHKGVNPRLVHRLDRETSGVMVIARNAATARVMMDKFRDREMNKTYWALVSPIPSSDTGDIDAPLRKINVGTDLEKIQVSKGGQSAQTSYRVLSKNQDRNIAWVEFSPHTGRTHQIRVHAAHMGFPLIGDKKYDGDVDVIKKLKGPMRVHLHAARLAFDHPRSGEGVVFTAPLGDDLKKSWQACGFKEDKNGR